MESEAERQAVFRLRYHAYRRENFIEPNPEELLYDRAYDDSPNAFILGIYVDGELAGTIRIHIGSDESAILPSMAVFGDVIMPRLRAGHVIVDITRSAWALEFSRRFPELVYVTLRAGWMAAEHFEANYILATTRAEHQAFYKRVFGHELWSEPRDYPMLNLKIVCMGLNYQAQKERVEARYPFFGSTKAERKHLFGSSTEVSHLVESSAYPIYRTSPIGDARMDGALALDVLPSRVAFTKPTPAAAPLKEIAAAPREEIAEEAEDFAAMAEIVLNKTARYVEGARKRNAEISSMLEELRSKLGISR